MLSATNLQFDVFTGQDLIGKTINSVGYAPHWGTENIALAIFNALQKANPNFQVQDYTTISVSKVLKKPARNLKMGCHETIYYVVVFIETGYTTPNLEHFGDKYLTNGSLSTGKQTISEFPGGFVISKLW